MLVHHMVPSMRQLRVLLLSLDGMLVHHSAPSMKRLGLLLLPLDGILVHHRVPSMKLLGVFNTTPPGWDTSPSQGTQHEATRSILYYSLLDGMLVHHSLGGSRESTGLHNLYGMLTRFWGKFYDLKAQATRSQSLTRTSRSPKEFVMNDIENCILTFYWSQAMKNSDHNAEENNPLQHLSLAEEIIT